MSEVDVWYLPCKLMGIASCRQQRSLIPRIQSLRKWTSKVSLSSSIKKIMDLGLILQKNLTLSYVEMFPENDVWTCDLSHCVKMFTIYNVVNPTVKDVHNEGRVSNLSHFKNISQWDKGYLLDQTYFCIIIAIIFI